MKVGHRLPEGGLIYRDQRLSFTFNGRRMMGCAGDTLASALLANGVRVVGRSFKYHRPRGIFSSGTEEPNALVQLEAGAHTLANQQATRIELYDGLSAESINCWPGPDFDVMGIMGGGGLEKSPYRRGPYPQLNRPSRALRARSGLIILSDPLP